MELKNGTLEIGNLKFKTGTLDKTKPGVAEALLDVLETILVLAQDTHEKTWTKAKLEEILLTEYRSLLYQSNVFCWLLQDVSRHTDELAPLWWARPETLTHDLVTEDDAPWDDEEGEPTQDRPSTDELRAGIADALITPRNNVPFISISRHIIDNQEQGAWVVHNPRLAGVYVDSFDRCLVIGLEAQKRSEFAWFDNLYGALEEDELEVLCEFLSLMMDASRLAGPLSTQRLKDEVDQMALVVARDLAERWHEGPVGTLMDDYLRGGPVAQAAERAARIPHRM